MFKIFLAVLVIASGQVSIYTSEESYDTKEACDAVREERVATVQKYFDDTNVEVKLASKCDVPGEPT